MGATPAQHFLTTLQQADPETRREFLPMLFSWMVRNLNDETKLILLEVLHEDIERLMLPLLIQVAIHLVRDHPDISDEQLAVWTAEQVKSRVHEMAWTFSKLAKKDIRKQLAPALMKAAAMTHTKEKFPERNRDIRAGIANGRTDREIAEDLQDKHPGITAGMVKSVRYPRRSRKSKRTK
jgi:hypothetical protein